VGAGAGVDRNDEEDYQDSEEPDTITAKKVGNPFDATDNILIAKLNIDELDIDEVEVETDEYNINEENIDEFDTDETEVEIDDHNIDEHTSQHSSSSIEESECCASL